MNDYFTLHSIHNSIMPYQDIYIVKNTTTHEDFSIEQTFRLIAVLSYLVREKRFIQLLEEI